MLFRSLRSLAGRALAAGTASALTLTLFNAAQPSLSTHKVHPGTLKTVKVPLTPAPAPSVASGCLPRASIAGQAAVSAPGLWTTPPAPFGPGLASVPASRGGRDPGRVAEPASGSATLPLRGPAPEPGR